MKRIFVYLLVAIAAACASESPTPNVTQTAAWVQQYSMPSPPWLLNVSPCEGCGGFPIARCITIMYGDLATLIPDEDPLQFLSGLTIEVDGQSVLNEDTVIAIQGEGVFPTIQTCVDTSNLETGLHVGIVRIQVDTRIDEMYSWVFEIEDEGS